VRFWTVLLLSSGCVRESDVLAESEPVVWRYDPAAPSSLTVLLQAALTTEAGPWARLDPIASEVVFTFEEPVPNGVLGLILVSAENQELALGPPELVAGLSTTCRPAEGCTSRAQADLELAGGSDPVEVTVQASMWMGGRWRDTGTDVWTEATVTVE
jgi:hypothetical protein